MSISLVEELREANFGDKRLNRRLQIIAEEFGANPNLSIPAATTGRAEMEATYRFFDNDKVTSEKILQPHFQATRERISQNDFVLLVQDTTELNLTRPNQQVQGAGPLGSMAQHGVFFHPMLAFDLGGLPLGLAWQTSWVREKIETQRTKVEKRRKLIHTPIEDKESFRWISGIQAAGDVAQACPETTCVCVADSEADIYELFAESDRAKSENLHLLIRTYQKRTTTNHVDWLQQVRTTQCLYKCSVDVSARKAKIDTSKRGKREKSRNARVAAMEVRAATVTLRPPHRFDRKLPEVSVNLVLVEESNPPIDCEPIRWLLATTLSIDDSEQVEENRSCILLTVANRNFLPNDKKQVAVLKVANSKR